MAQQVQSNPSYYAGRAAANTTVAASFGRFSRGVGPVGKSAIQTSAGVTGFSFASYIVLVEKIESTLPPCECLK